MKFDALKCGPTEADLTPIISSPSCLVVSGFYGRTFLEKLSVAGSTDLRLAVRLPLPGTTIPKVLPNDPRPLAKLLKERPDIVCYVNPRLHAKIYVSDAGGIIGSSNLSANGFSGGNEAVLVTADPAATAALKKAAEDFCSAAVPADRDWIKKLVKAVASGRSRVMPPPETPVENMAPDQLGNPPYDDFLAWLSIQKGEDAKHVSKLALGKNRMSGHAYVGYQGLAVMARSDPSWAQMLATESWEDDAAKEAMGRLKPFLKENPGEIRGKRGGQWEGYLPRDLGGKQTSGGGSKGLLRRMIVVVPRYLRERNLLG